MLKLKTYTKYLRKGITLRPVRGNHQYGDFMFSFYHDNVQYTLDDSGDYEEGGGDDEYMDMLISSLAMIIERHHSTVKNVYNYIQKAYNSDVWVRAESGEQLRVTFGNEDGFICSLCLTYVDATALDELNEQLREEVGDESAQLINDGVFYLYPNNEKHNQYFKQLRVENVHVVPHNPMWFDDNRCEDEDE